MRFLILVVFCFAFACNSKKNKKPKSDYITRKSDSFYFLIKAPKRENRKLYLWEKENLIKITDGFFCCKGSFSNKKVEGRSKIYSDCKCGRSLPILNGKKRIYPIFLEIANYLQEMVNKKVVITSGYRCQDHDRYVLQKDKLSKYSEGKVFSFYMYEMDKEKILDTILGFYKNRRYKNQKEYVKFKKKGNAFFNKEIVVRFFKENEKRNFDNRHSYPYVEIELLFDRDREL